MWYESLRPCLVQIIDEGFAAGYMQCIGRRYEVIRTSKKERGTSTASPVRRAQKKWERLVQTGLYVSSEFRLGPPWILVTFCPTDDEKASVPVCGGEPLASVLPPDRRPLLLFLLGLLLLEPTKKPLVDESPSS